MAYIKRNVQIYINWNECRIMTQEEYESIREERLDEKLQDEWDFREWLEGDYTIGEVFHMDENERETVRERYAVWCEECVEDGMRDDGYAVEETEVEIWVETQQNLNGWKD